MTRLLHPFKVVLILASCMLVVGACDSTRDIVDAANPVSWFEEDEKPATDSDPKPVPGEGEDYPRLATVPERPSTPEIKSRFESLRSGLVADQQNARYSDEAIRRTPPPETDRGQAALSALQAAPEEPPVAQIEEAPSGTQPSSEQNEEESTAVSRQTKPQPAIAPKPPAATQSTAETVESLSPRSSKTTSPAPNSAPNSAPAPEPITEGNQEGNDRPSPPPETAALMTQTAQDGSPSEQDRQTDEAPGEQLVATIYFPGGGSQLTDDDIEILRQVAQIYSGGGQTVRIIGHSAVATDNGASQDSLIKYKSSLDRASSVASVLVDFGVPRSAVSVDARGSSAPRYEETTREGIAANRRAEIVIGF